MIMVILGVVFFAIGALFFWIGNLFGGQDFAGGAASGGGIGMDIGGIAFFIGGLVFIGIGVATRRSAANRKRIEATGVAGQATITDIGETNMMVNERPVLNLSLTVTIPGQAPYPIQQRMVMPWNAMGRMVVGATVPVMVDPANPSEVVIEWSGQSAARATAGGMAGGISPHIPQPNTLSTMGPTVAAPNQLGAAPGVNVVQLGSQVGGTGTASGEALLAYLRTMGVNISGPVASMVVNAANAHNARIFSMSGQMMPGGMMMAGATPKLTKSARLSSSAPKRDVPLIMRATRPSIASRIAAKTIAATASSSRPSIARRIPVSPAHNASSVMTFGTSWRTGIWRSRCILRSWRSGSKRP